MTKEEFINQKAEESGITPEKFEEILKSQGLEVVPCDCGHPVCKGFNIVDHITNQN